MRMRNTRHEPPSAYERVAEEHLMTRLTRAKALLAGGLRRNLGRIRTLLAEAADQADGFEIAATEKHATRNAMPMCRLTRAMLAKAGGEPVGEFLLIPFGDVEVERPLSGRDFEFTKGHAESALQWFASLGRKLAIDYEHQSFERHNSRADGLRPAAGWVGGLEVREDGLWATDVSWTPRAKELLAAGEYRYFSPVIFWTDEDYSDVAGLGPVALTNDPAMRGVTPLAASRSAVPRSATEEDEVAADARDETEVTGTAQDEPVSRGDLEEAQAEVALLRRQLEAQQADMFIERGMRLGKILDSTSLDWREDFLRDAGKAEARLTRAQVLRPPGRQVATLGAGRSERDVRTSELYRQWGVDAEDLQAYERAVAAGRVRAGPR